MTSAKRLFWGREIACRRGGRLLFQNLSFGLERGGILHLAGANGAGKTSLLRILAGLLPAAAGDIRWDGSGFLENGMEAHAGRLSFLPADDRSLKPSETAGEHVRFWGAVRGGAFPAAGQAALAAVDLLPQQATPVRHLSAGQRRRLSLARIFLRPTPLWLLDEPLSGLDDSSRRLFWRALDAHCRAGGLAVIASHQPLEHAAAQRLQMGPS